MAFLGRCYGCREDNHNEHTDRFDTPTDPNRIGGGICVCYACVPKMAHLDKMFTGGVKE